MAAAAIVFVVALALGSRSASSGAPSSTAVSAKAVSVKVDMYAFMPDTLTVRVGTRVTFTNHDMTAHTATALAGTFDTGTIKPGQSKTIIVKRAGTYPYHCLFHAFMSGTIKVIS